MPQGSPAVTVWAPNTWDLQACPSQKAVPKPCLAQGGWVWQPVCGGKAFGGKVVALWGYQGGVPSCRYGLGAKFKGEARNAGV